tara:strand:- start:60 stop:593 length:534 start_codon:yes stop_codon:yes gene_type:complete
MAVWNAIAHQELSSGATSVSFASIAASYDHLVLLSSARSDASEYNSYINFRVNNDSGSNYSRRAINATTTTENAVTGNSNSIWIYQWIPGASSLADNFGTTETWFIDYSNTTTYKQILSRSFNANHSTTNSQWGARVSSGVWSSTAAIDRVDALCNESGDDFVQYSSFTLYGINGAG